MPLGPGTRIGPYEIYGLEDTNGTPALALEFVEGEDLEELKAILASGGVR